MKERISSYSNSRDGNQQEPRGGRIVKKYQGKLSVRSIGGIHVCTVQMLGETPDDKEYGEERDPVHMRVGVNVRFSRP